MIGKFQGVYPIVNSPFREDGTIDLDSQLRLVRFLIDGGAHGLGLFGNASEGYALSGVERSELGRAIIEEVAGRVPVIVSTGHTGTDVAVAMSREAEAAGADALMVLPPYFVKPDAEGIFDYFRAISDAVTIPIMVQDAPLMTQVNMPPALLARMGRELENVRMVKIEAPPTPTKITATRELAGDDFLLIGGLNGNFLIEELDRGGLGTMPGSDMVDLFRRIWDLYANRDRKRARELFTRALPLIRYELQPGLGVSAMKHNLRDAGIIESARVRHPTKSLDEAGIRDVRELREDLDLFAFRWGKDSRAPRETFYSSI